MFQFVFGLPPSPPPSRFMCVSVPSALSCLPTRCSSPVSTCQGCLCASWQSEPRGRPSCRLATASRSDSAWRTRTRNRYRAPGNRWEPLLDLGRQVSLPSSPGTPAKPPTYSPFSSICLVQWVILTHGYLLDFIPSSLAHFSLLPTPPLW